MPTYLEQRWGLDGSETWLAMVPFWFAGFSTPSAAYYADRWMAAEYKPTLLQQSLSPNGAAIVATKVRKRMACAGFGAAAFFGCAAYAAPSSAAVAVAWIGLSSGCSFVASGGGYEPAKLEVAAPETAGLLQGISQTIGNSAALVSVPAAAAIATAASWDAVFLLLALCYGAAAFVFWQWGTARRLFSSTNLARTTGH